MKPDTEPDNISEHRSDATDRLANGRRVEQRRKEEVYFKGRDQRSGLERRSGKDRRKAEERRPS